MRYSGNCMKKFGVLPSGKDVFEYTISNANGMSLSAINYGGIITKLYVPSHDGSLHNVVLSYPNLNGYLSDTFYIGALIGRCANRIAHASFVLYDDHYYVTKNYGTINLNGGVKGIHVAYWNMSKKRTLRGECLELRYRSVDGEEGYPGNLDILVLYELLDTNELNITYTANSDAPTIANFTQHSYFNLSGSLEDNVLQHSIEFFGSQFLPVQSDGIPLGTIRPISELCKSQASLCSILESQSAQIQIAQGLDHCFVVSDASSQELHKCVKIMSPATNIALTVYSNQEAFQCYSGNFLTGNFVKHAGLCIETQAYTNAINEVSFPSVVLEPHTRYERITVFSFS